ncbi:ARM repeat-containing protein [Lactarius indigo]|nr:ARM repeat-containing protein [Lactarius indigo]
MNERQSPPAFLDLADSTARLGSNMPRCQSSTRGNRALHRKMSLLSIPADGNGNALQHMAASAPTTPPRVNTLLPGGPDVSPTLRTGFAPVGSVSDKRKSIPSNNPHGNNGLGQGYGRAGAKSLPASRRTSASSHDEELAGHLQGLSMAGEVFPSVANQEHVPSQKNGTTHDEDGLRYGNAYNAGMMLDEQLDEEMNSEYNYLISTATSNLSASSAALDLAALSQAPSRTSVIGRVGDAPNLLSGRSFQSHLGPILLHAMAVVSLPNPILSISDLSGNNKLGGTVSASATPHLPSHGQVLTAHIQAPAQNLGARLTPQGSHQLGDSPLSSDLQSSISRLSGHSQYDNFDSGYDDPLHPYGGDAAVYGLNNGNAIDDRRFNSYGNGNGLASTGSTALYHHHGSRYGLGIGGRVASDGKMNGLHGPKHRRGDVDREFNRFAGTRLEDLAGEISSLCKDQHGCRYLQKKLERGYPFGNYLCQKLLEYSTDEQRNIICESVAQDLVNISLNMHGTRATDHRYHGQIHSIIVALSLHVVVLIKDLNGNHVIQKCLNKLAPEDNQFIYNAVAANCVEVATHRHWLLYHASDHQRIQLVNEITYNALTLVVQYILDLNDNRFSDCCHSSVFIGNVCALSVQKFSSNVIEKGIGIRVAEHNTRKLLIEELLNRTRLEKLLRDSYGNYCVQTALDYAEPGQRALLVDGIRPVLPLIRNTPYGKRIQNKLQREQQHLDHFGGYHSQQALAVNMANHGAGRHLPADPLSGVYSGQNGMYSAGLPSQAQPALSQAGLRGPIHSLQPHALDNYVLQSNAGHAPHQGAFSAFGNVGVGSSFPGVSVASSLADPYQRTSFGYSM